MRKIRELDAPSTRAASIRSRGSPMKKLRSRKIASGRPNAVWASQIATGAVGDPQLPENGQQRHERHLQRNDHQRDDEQEDRVAEREGDPGEP